LNSFDELRVTDMTKKKYTVTDEQKEKQKVTDNELKLSNPGVETDVY
jgi:hypothetical protein